MATVVLLGTLDTKGAEYGYLRDRLREQGVDVLVVDAGIFEPQIDADIAHDEVAAAAGADLTALRDAGDRGAAVEAMCLGAAEVVRRLHAESRLDGFLSVGGSGNSSIGAAAARALPVGVPKLIVSTVASGDTRPYMGAKDVSMTYSVVDISGLNRISERILSNAAGAIAGMAKMTVPESGKGRPLIGATMFGVTTPAVTRARERLEELGYEVLVFHATGTGGQSMEALARGGFLAGVLDRLEAAGELGLPQVVSLGALDMVNFGPRETVPPQFEDRNIYVHNPTVTLMRTTPAECAELGRRIARKLSAATGPTVLFVPLKGVSMIATEGGPFHDPAADEALFSALRVGLEKNAALGGSVELHELDLDVNDPAFADAMANRLHELISDQG
jgi:uncharacterized protein (UPF0261 family)